MARVPTEQQLQQAVTQARAEMEAEAAAAVVSGGAEKDGAQDALARVHRSTPMARNLSRCATVLEKVAKHFMSRSYTWGELIGINSQTVTGVCDATSVEPITCPTPAVPEFRSANGRCNNLHNPLWGSAEQPFKRMTLAEPNYDDVLMTPRTTGRDGTPLPSARLVSRTMQEDLRKSSHVNTHMVMQFGQFLDHDITLTPNFQEEGLHCTCDSDDERCFNIDIPSDDPDFAGRRCLPFARSLPSPNEGCRLGQRQQLNQLTAFVDASNVYGSSEEEMEALREHSGGAVNSWHQIDGQLMKFVSVGRSGVWGVDSNDRIYYRTGTYQNEASPGTGWVRIDGALKQISSGNNIVWGVNSNDDIYIRLGISSRYPQGTGWRQIPGQLKQVHISPTSNQVWGVNSWNNIYRRTGITASNPAGTNWQQISGWLKFVSIGRAGVWGVNSYNQIYYRTGTSGDEASAGHSWVQVDGSLTQITSGDGEVWGVNSNNQIYVRREDGGRELIEGDLKQVYVSSSSNQVWGVSSAGSVYRGIKQIVSSGARGLLKSRPNPADGNQKELLPAAMEEEFECDGFTGSETCSQAGDVRVNEQPGLTSMHTVFLREHNRIARRLSQLNPHWDDDRVFFETRKIVGALMQKITYGEDLPHVLGPDAMYAFYLSLTPNGQFYSGYNRYENPTISNVFATAAYRFGHSLVDNHFLRYDPDFNEASVCPIRLAFSFFNPSPVLNNGPDSILRGLTTQPHQDFDRFMVSGLTKKLFADPPGSDRGLDLAALNIQRGRDHGLPGYNSFRSRCGLSAATGFDGLAREIPDPNMRQRLQSLYRNVNDIDVFVGGLAEESSPGGIVGPTFACLIAQQFQDLRKGDRFWFENRGQFTAAQLTEIKKTSLARILCDNTDGTTHMQPDVFMLPTQPGNERVACSSLSQMDLTKWQE
ncbi:PREDICTED: myeloperoxidase-like [Branchiostoma belcheri]|uniref:Myeloperoxidase-like n=1 Tax=Branchiostoma belcheri TaxID=7741 RepID=A0A6P5A1K3_BRABE|nr:PREDICTED: myeloperoxidase-like [Branchiostoma belcheri]